MGYTNAIIVRSTHALMIISLLIYHFFFFLSAVLSAFGCCNCACLDFVFKPVDYPCLQLVRSCKHFPFYVNTLVVRCGKPWVGLVYVSCDSSARLFELLKADNRNISSIQWTCFVVQASDLEDKQQRSPDFVLSLCPKLIKCGWCWITCKKLKLWNMTCEICTSFHEFTLEIDFACTLFWLIIKLLEILLSREMRIAIIDLYFDHCSFGLNSHGVICNDR